MHIQSVDFSNFRNYKRLHLDLSEGVHIFHGDNGQGKSNLLEAVYLSSVNKSFRGSKDKEMILFGEQEAHIKLFFLKKDVSHRIDFHLKENGTKGIAVDAVPIRKTKDFLGTFHCILFSPEDLQIVKNGPSERRKFLDTELCVLDPIYCDAFLKYRKVLEQRNQLLKDLNLEPSLMDTLSVWDEQLVNYGSLLIERRREFLNELNEIVSAFHQKLSGNQESLKLIYEPNVSAEDFKKEVRFVRNKDIYARTTTVGPHRDDFEFRITEMTEKKHEIDSRIYGSQGQQRTCALSLKMAEIEIVKKKTGDTPVLLLDDVLSELDHNRQQYLLDSLTDIQTLITCTGLDEFLKNTGIQGKVYHVVNGEIQDGE